MKVAFACWGNRIAPVFDTARNVSLVEVASGRTVSRTHETLPEGMPLQRAGRLVELGIHTLVCGAISQSFQALIVSHGIVVIPFVAGDLKEVIDAWNEGDLIDEKFAMPGCCGRNYLKHRNRQYDGGLHECECPRENDVDGIKHESWRRKT